MAFQRSVNSMLSATASRPDMENEDDFPTRITHFTAAAIVNRTRTVSYFTFQVVLLKRHFQDRISFGHLKGDANVYGRQKLRIRKDASFAGFRDVLHEAFPVLRNTLYELANIEDGRLRPLDPMDGVGTIKARTQSRKLYVNPSMDLPNQPCCRQQAQIIGGQAPRPSLQTDQPRISRTPSPPGTLGNGSSASSEDGDWPLPCIHTPRQTVPQAGSAGTPTVQGSGTPTVQFGKLTSIKDCLGALKPTTLDLTRVVLDRSNPDPAIQQIAELDEAGASRRPYFVFANEQGIDDHGPSIEGFRILLQHLADKGLFFGGGCKTFTYDALRLSRKEYRTAGQVVAYAMVWGGQLPQFFHPEVYKLLIDPEADVIFTVEDLPIHFQGWVRELRDAASPQQFDEAAEKHSQLLEMAGADQLALYDKRESLCSALCQHLGAQFQQPAIRQFRAGLKTLGVLEMMLGSPALMKEAFVPSQEPLTA